MDPPHSLPLPASVSISEAIDDACRTGALRSLNWWKHHSGPSLSQHIEYTDSALESASAKNHIHILDWWLNSDLPLKIGRSMDVASGAGHVGVLEWFREHLTIRNALDVKYDKTAMHHASLHGRVDVLQWWLDSGLQLIFDADALTLASKHNRRLGKHCSLHLSLTSLTGYQRRQVSPSKVVFDSSLGYQLTQRHSWR